MVTVILLAILAVLVVVAVFASFADFPEFWGFVLIYALVAGCFGVGIPATVVFSTGSPDYTVTVNDTVYYCERETFMDDESQFWPGLVVEKYNYAEGSADCYEVDK